MIGANKKKSDFATPYTVSNALTKGGAAVKNDHCLTDAFNKIINYRYDNIFQKEKKEVTKELEKINHDLTENITKNHTDVIRNVLKELISMERMGVDLSADITFDKNAGGTFQELPCKGMFTGKIGAVSLNTTKPTGSLTMSNFAGLNWFMSKATVEVEMTIPTEKAYEKIAAGTPVEITVKLNNVEGKLYIVQKDQTFLVLNTDPTPAG